MQEVVAEEAAAASGSLLSFVTHAYDLGFLACLVSLHWLFRSAEGRGHGAEPRGCRWCSSLLCICLPGTTVSYIRELACSPIQPSSGCGTSGTEEAAVKEGVAEKAAPAAGS